MADRGHRRSELVRTLVGIGVALLIVITALIATVEIQDRNDRMLEQRIARATSDLKVTGRQIAGMRDALTTNMSEYISTHKELEPLLGQYDNKLSLLREAYDQAQDRESRRELVDLVRGYRRYNPGTWENMREIIDITGEINDVMKRQASVIHDMASLPESERLRFWHEHFLPLQRREQTLRERLVIVGQRMSTVPMEQ